MPKSTIDTLVIYAPITDAATSAPLYPPERQAEIDRCKNDRTRREKYLVWKLLERAVSERFNLDFANLKFTKSENGQWSCPEFCFSLAHTDGAVCVAVSSSPVGVDIEKVAPVREGLYSRVLTDSEREELLRLPEGEGALFFLETWVKKESLFKRDGGECLAPRSRDTLSSDAITERVTVGDSDYLIGLAAKNENYKICYMEAI